MKLAIIVPEYYKQENFNAARLLLDTLSESGKLTYIESYLRPSGEFTATVETDEEYGNLLQVLGGCDFFMVEVNDD